MDANKLEQGMDEVKERYEEEHHKLEKMGKKVHELQAQKPRSQVMITTGTTFREEDDTRSGRTMSRIRR